MKTKLNTIQKNLLYSMLVLLLASFFQTSALSIILMLFSPIVAATLFTKDKAIAGRIGHSVAGFGMSLTAATIGIGIGSAINPVAYESFSTAPESNSQLENKDSVAETQEITESSEPTSQEAEPISQKIEENVTLRIGSDFIISNMKIRKVEDSAARSGYVFQITGDITNDGVNELTVAGSVGVSLGACAFAKMNDEHGRKFEVSCDIPAMLPGETIQNVVIAQSSAMSDSTEAKLCLSPINCTPLMKVE